MDSDKSTSSYREEYNKKYYEENKDKINEKLAVKEECKYCFRKVSHQNLKKHMLSDYCMTRRNIHGTISTEKLKSTVEDIIAELKAKHKQEIDELTKQLNELKEQTKTKTKTKTK